MKIRNFEIGSGSPLIAVPIMDSEKSAMIHTASDIANTKADIVELRLDRFEGIRDTSEVLDLLTWVRKALNDQLLLVTVRSREQGGEGDLTEQELRSLYRAIAEESLCDLIDVEFFTLDRAEQLIQKIQSKGIRVISSHHDFEDTPDNAVIDMLLEQMQAGGADIVKLAVMPQNTNDVFRLMQATDKFRVKNPKTPIITMSMGKLGAISRLTGEFYGSAVTFASWKESSAPGQLPVDRVSTMTEYLHEVMR